MKSFVSIVPHYNDLCWEGQKDAAFIVVMNQFHIKLHIESWKTETVTAWYVFLLFILHE